METSKDEISSIVKIYEKFKDFFEIPCINCGETVFTLLYKEGVTHRIKCTKCEQITYIRIIDGGIHTFTEEEKCKSCNGTGICSKCSGTGKVICENCDGKGYYTVYYEDWDCDIYIPCEKCGGFDDNVARDTSKDLFKAVKKGKIGLGSGKVECPYCNGTGRCPECNGVGHR